MKQFTVLLYVPSFKVESVTVYITAADTAAAIVGAKTLAKIEDRPHALIGVFDGTVHNHAKGRFIAAA